MGDKVANPEGFERGDVAQYLGSSGLETLGGMIGGVGGTVLGGKEGSLTVESRFFNQNAINVSGEIRF